MTIPTHCELFNYPIYPQPADIETIYGGKKIVKSVDTKECFLAFSKDEIQYELLLISSFKQSKSFSQASINFRLWIDQRIQLIENFMSEYYENA